MAASSLYQIERLDEKNFETWSVQMKSILIHSGYWKHVNGEEIKDPAWDAGKKKEWDSTDALALATIMLSVKTSQLNYIKNCSTSNDAWKKLIEVYKTNGPLQKVGLYKKLLSLNMKEFKNMVEYLNAFSNVVEKLVDVGIVIQDELLVIILLSSLPKDFENFVMVIETRDTLPSFAVIKLKLLEEAERKNQQAGGSGNHVFGAVKKETFIKHNNNNKNASSSKIIKGNCFICGKKGHYADKCKEKREDRHHSYSLIAMAKANNQNSSSWYVDSGATSHMSSNRKFFNKYEEANDVIMMADKKSVEAKGKGVVNIDINGTDIELPE